MRFPRDTRIADLHAADSHATDPHAAGTSSSETRKYTDALVDLASGSTLSGRLSRAVSSRRARILAAAVALCGFGLTSGCDTAGLLDPTQTVRGGHPTEPLVVPILYKLDPNDEPGNSEFVNATNPTPDDLITHNYDYTISPNDLLQIQISDLMGPGQETQKTSRVTESGTISLPFIGQVRAEGLTENELEQSIASAYAKANIVANSTVSVTVVEARGRSVEILGAVGQPGQYAIMDPDFRLIDALVLARDVTAQTLDYIYVIRRSDNHRRHAPTTQPMNPSGAGPEITPPARNLAPGGGPSSAPAPGSLAPQGRGPAANPDTLADQSSANHPLSLLAQAPGTPDDLAPGATGTRPTPPTTGASTSPGTGANAGTNGAGGANAGNGPNNGANGMNAAAAGGDNAQPFEFNGPPSNGSYRVLRIPYQALRAGDLNYNIAIRPRDIIIAQAPQIGVYYVSGHVTRGGVYNLTGQKITLKQAIESAGMFDELAIPQRTDVIRRIKPDREVFVRIDLAKIFAGDAPDVFLKPDDQVVVGTNALAPFLAALRGSFRITYGFGFLYDRNYAYSTNGGIGF